MLRLYKFTIQVLIAGSLLLPTYLCITVYIKVPETNCMCI